VRFNDETTEVQGATGNLGDMETTADQTRYAVTLVVEVAALPTVLDLDEGAFR
jgi:hypothetical protein